MPSFVYFYGLYPSTFEMVVNRFQNVLKADSIFLNTFYKLEEEVTKWMSRKWQVKAIGPTIPSMYLDKRLQDDEGYDVSVLKPTTRNFHEETSDKGSIVSWCPQLEALSLRVPMVAMPQWKTEKKLEGMAPSRRNWQGRLLMREGVQTGTSRTCQQHRLLQSLKECGALVHRRRIEETLHTLCLKPVDAYEAKNQELVAENADLRALLRSMQVDMRAFLNAPNGKQSSPVNTRVDSDLSHSPLGGRTDMFDLPLHMARDQIEESLRTKMASIKERMVQLQDAQKAAELTSEVSERELELEAQLVEARSIIQEQVSVARTCNCIYALLQQRQRDVEFRESANEQRQRLLSDISRLEAKVERLEAQLSAKDREIATMTRTEAKATAAFKSQIDKLQQERDEFQKMVLGNQQVRTQQIHEMKKKEKEYIKLQERLNQVLMEKKKESRSGMEIMNLLQKEGRRRGTWNGRKTDNDFYKKIVDAYEAKNQELVAENADLRALLRSMQVDMRAFLNAPNGKQSSPVNTRVDSDLSHSPLGGRTDMFDLPLHMARDQIEESLRTKMASIKERMVQLQDAQKAAELTSEVSERELELEAQLVEARSIIQEQ
ncbi:UNVERIFIED_CONTAM: UDP-glycosyltransferase 74E2, partial [Sesamum indicum]